MPDLLAIRKRGLRCLSSWSRGFGCLGLEETFGAGAPESLELEALGSLSPGVELG